MRFKPNYKLLGRFIILPAPFSLAVSTARTTVFHLLHLAPPPTIYYTPLPYYTISVTGNQFPTTLKYKRHYYCFASPVPPVHADIFVGLFNIQGARCVFLTLYRIPSRSLSSKNTGLGPDSTLTIHTVFSYLFQKMKFEYIDKNSAPRYLVIA